MVVTAGALAAAAMTISGCGAASTIDPVAKAATVSTGTPGYQMKFALAFTSPQLPTALTMTGNGAIDARDRIGQVNFAMNVGNNRALTKAFGGSTVHFQELFKGTTFYVKLPHLPGSKLPANKPWLKVDLAKASGIPGFSALANNPVSSDPSQMLGYLRASGSVNKVGSDVINGVQTTHYHATIDLSKVPNALPAANRASAKQAIASIEKLTGLHQLPVDTWVDSNNLVRRMRMTFAESLAPAVKISTLMTIDITKYGPQPAPVLPSSDQVSDVSSLAGLGG
ncbi:MAG TPA: hypothetical protein VGF93_04150 [Solirubrobacteraceae bacterium]|jgi:hypothetical protein